LSQTGSPVSGNISPEKIMTLASGFWASKVLLSAVELGLFTILAEKSMDVEDLGNRLNLHRRSAKDFFDALVSLGMAERNGELYSNTVETDYFLDKSKPSYIGGWLEMFNERLYRFWGSLTEGLRTGKPQNEIKSGEDLFSALYGDPARLKIFLHAMTGLSMGDAQAIAQKFPWSNYKTFYDVGAAEGGVPVQVALMHEHLVGGGFDLPVVQPIFESYIRSFGLEKRLKFVAGDFFKDPIPRADVIIMGHILHDWNLEDKLLLIEKVYEILPPNGACILYESIIDDERRHNTAGLLMSLNMLIETQGGFDYTAKDCMKWMKDTGFRETFSEHLVGPDSMVVGIK
jgi:predicted transcriptional regulator